LTALSKALRFSRFSEFWVVAQLKEYTQLEAQLVSERIARQGLEASLWEQKMITEKIAAESRAAAEKAAAESDKAVKEALERAAMAHANEVNRLLQQCKVKKLI
jgi:membrane protein involved in colicin uptake